MKIKNGESEERSQQDQEELVLGHERPQDAHPAILKLFVSLRLKLLFLWLSQYALNSKLDSPPEFFVRWSSLLLLCVCVCALQGVGS